MSINIFSSDLYSVNFYLSFGTNFVFLRWFWNFIVMHCEMSVCIVAKIFFQKQIGFCQAQMGLGSHAKIWSDSTNIGQNIEQNDKKWISNQTLGTRSVLLFVSMTKCPVNSIAMYCCPEILFCIQNSFYSAIHEQFKCVIESRSRYTCYKLEVICYKLE